MQLEDDPGDLPGLYNYWTPYGIDMSPDAMNIAQTAVPDFGTMVTRSRGMYEPVKYATSDPERMAATAALWEQVLPRLAASGAIPAGNMPYLVMQPPLDADIGLAYEPEEYNIGTIYPESVTQDDIIRVMRKLYSPASGAPGNKYRPDDPPTQRENLVAKPRKK